MDSRIESFLDGIMFLVLAFAAAVTAHAMFQEARKSFAAANVPPETVQLAETVVGTLANRV